LLIIKNKLFKLRNIASDFIEAQKQIVDSFQSHGDRNSNNVNFTNGLWDWYNPQRIAENNAIVVNNFTNYLLTTNNLVNSALASNIRTYNTALEQIRDNVKAFTKTNTNYIKSVALEQESVNRHNTEINTNSH
jgi:hypothetical protein